jgi:hypothetical protein
MIRKPERRRIRLWRRWAENITAGLQEIVWVVWIGFIRLRIRNSGRLL